MTSRCVGMLRYRAFDVWHLDQEQPLPNRKSLLGLLQKHGLALLVLDRGGRDQADLSGDGRQGPEVSPDSPRHDHFIQRQILYGKPNPGILSLQLFQPFELVPAHAPIFLK